MKQHYPISRAAALVAIAVGVFNMDVRANDAAAGVLTLKSGSGAVASVNLSEGAQVRIRTAEGDWVRPDAARTFRASNGVQIEIGCSPGAPIRITAAEVEFNPASAPEANQTPRGNYSATLQYEGRPVQVKLSIQNERVTIIESASEQFTGVRGQLQSIGNGVFLAMLESPRHRASQFWVTQPDGSIVIKEIPDRGERQKAVRLEE